MPYESEVRLSVNHDLSETFERERFNGKIVRKGEFNNLVTCLFKLQSHKFFDFLLYFHLFYTYGNATYQPRVNGSPNTEFLQEKLRCHLTSK